MRRLFFQKPNATVITAIMTGQTPESLIGQSRGAEFDGADAIAVDLCDLRPEFRNRESLERVINAVNLPFMFYFYRNDKASVEMDFFVRDSDSLVPVEVKASDNATKSLNKLIENKTGTFHDIRYGIKLCYNNIGFNGKFYTFPYFLTFKLKQFLKEQHKFL